MDPLPQTPQAPRKQDVSERQPLGSYFKDAEFLDEPDGGFRLKLNVNTPQGETNYKLPTSIITGKFYHLDDPSDIEREIRCLVRRHINTVAMKGLPTPRGQKYTEEFWASFDGKRARVRELKRIQAIREIEASLQISPGRSKARNNEFKKKLEEKSALADSHNGAFITPSNGRTLAMDRDEYDLGPAIKGILKGWHGNAKLALKHQSEADPDGQREPRPVKKVRFDEAQLPKYKPEEEEAIKTGISIPLVRKPKKKPSLKTRLIEDFKRRVEHVQDVILGRTTKSYQKQRAKAQKIRAELLKTADHLQKEWDALKWRNNPPMVVEARLSIENRIEELKKLAAGSFYVYTKLYEEISNIDREMWEQQRRVSQLKTRNDKHYAAFKADLDKLAKITLANMVKSERNEIEKAAKRERKILEALRA
ncbi:hypothetical protein ABW19_dt0202140 [Dactylella cylindrospora]|nr:hypothetical protein ABW19_dt0202140 [Dactylella cylindrospora]